MRIDLEECGLSFDLPEGMLPMTPEDYRALGRAPAPDTWAARDAQRHLILEIAWKKMSFLSRLVGVEKSAALAQTQIARAAAAFRKRSSEETRIGGERACGFAYDYTASGTEMTARYLVLRHQDQMLSFSLLASAAASQAADALRETVFSSAAFR